jgi:hypothetical protein
MLKIFFKKQYSRLSLKGLYFEISKATKDYLYKNVRPSTTVMSLEKSVHV